MTASHLHGRHLHVDCASGAAGDMMLGALIDLGVPLDAIGAALDAIGAGRERLHVTRVVKHGIAAVDVKVDTRGELAGAHPHVHHAASPHVHPAAPALAPRAAAASPGARPRLHMHSHGAPHHRELPGAHVGAEPGPAHGDPTHAAGDHTHAHGLRPATDHDHLHSEHAHGAASPDPTAEAHAHYHYAEIRRRIAEAPLTPGTRRRALDIFDRIARAEARLHGTTVADVVFHEVGAIDSVVDVVGTAAALDYLSPREVSCASVAMGHGTITCAHGVLPVPAPAALEALREAGGVMADGGVARELCTPTGAAILAATVTRWTAAPPGRPLAVGWGAGDVELADRANVLRVIALDPAAAARASDPERVWQIDANIDDMSPELCGPASDALFAAGALDVWWTPITMKKGRPALMLSALATEAARREVAQAILRETTTIGVRYAERERTVLARTIHEVATPYGPIPVKVARDGDAILNAAPELDACVAAARTHGVAVKLVFAAAQAAFEATR
ncbi:MAG TPA: LarC family nickel insertion protein [Kofleriaceae bacterium]|nr:LarC family nickel insertion protein [Kofleriaceae bacterium]